MKSIPKISALQFFIMLFLSRSFTAFTINSQTVGEGNFLDQIISAVLLMITVFVLLIPLMHLNRMYPESSLLMIVKTEFGNFAKCISILYFLYFLVMNTVSLSLFLTLVINTMNPFASRLSIAVVLISIALFGAYKGIETVSRASICIFLLFLVGFVFIFIALIPHVNTAYAEPLLNNGINRSLRGFLFFFTRCTSLVELPVLFHCVEGKKRLGMSLWNGGITLFTSVLLFFVVSCLGEYAYIQLFPVYTLSTMAEVAGIQRLDALMIALSMMTLVIRLSCGFLSIGECCRALNGFKYKKYLLFGSGTAMVAATLWITQTSGRTGILFNTIYYLPFAVLFSIILPITIHIATSIKRRKHI